MSSHEGDDLDSTPQEQKRVMVLNRILAGQLRAAEAGCVLELSVLQVQRILAAYRKEGAAAVVHGNRGRQPFHTISAETRQQVLTLAQTCAGYLDHAFLKNDMTVENNQVR